MINNRLENVADVNLTPGWQWHCHFKYVASARSRYLNNSWCHFLDPVHAVMLAMHHFTRSNTLHITRHVRWASAVQNNDRYKIIVVGGGANHSIL